MEYFTFNTQATNKPIGIRGSELGTFKVIMTDNNGKLYTERNYEGLGILFVKAPERFKIEVTTF